MNLFRRLFRMTERRTPRIVGMASLYEPLNFLERRIENLNRCDLSDTLIHWSDCSPEGTWTKVRDLVRSMCKFDYVLDHQAGRTTLYRTWNWIASSHRDKADFFTNVNADDTHHPGYFLQMSRFLDKNPQAQIAGCSWFVTGKTDLGPGWPPDAENNQRLVPESGTMGHFPMWRASLFSEIGYFDERMLVIGDADFWDRIRGRYGPSAFGYVDDHLACYTSHAGNLYSTAKGPNGESGEAWDRGLMESRKKAGGR